MGAPVDTGRVPDLAGFASEIDALRQTFRQKLGAEDVKHLRSVERVGWAFKLIGYLTAWWLPNPISVVCLSLGQTTRWGIAHHVLHRGYDRVPGVPKRFTSTVFGAGWRRFVDWFDWIHPFGWAYEHKFFTIVTPVKRRIPTCLKEKQPTCSQRGYRCSLSIWCCS